MYTHYRHYMLMLHACAWVRIITLFLVYICCRLAGVGPDDVSVLKYLVPKHLKK